MGTNVSVTDPNRGGKGSSRSWNLCDLRVCRMRGNGAECAAGSCTCSVDDSLEDIDISSAGLIARSMVTEYCMRDCMGLVTYERARQRMFLPGNFAQSDTYREEKPAQIDEEIERFTDEAHQRVKKILSDRRKVLDELAHLLSEKESVQGDELRKMFPETERDLLTLSPEKE
jgi:hypothetical protein